MLGKRMVVYFAGAILFAFSILVMPAFANPEYKAPDNIKTQEQFWEFSEKFDFQGDLTEMNAFLKANQEILQKLYEGLVDIGFTSHLATQTHELRNRGEILNEGKKFKQISIPIRITTYNKDNSPFGMELSDRDLALVPKHIEKGKELFAVHIFPDGFSYIDQPGPFHKVFVDNWQEYFYFVNFTIPADQDEKQMNLRIYDGEEFIDLNVSK